jgi:hypothetical protein
MGWGHLKIFFSTTTVPILTRRGTNHPWVKRIQVYSKEGDSPSPRGVNSERVKMHRKFVKKKKSSSPESAGQNQSNFVQIILG